MYRTKIVLLLVGTIAIAVTASPSQSVHRPPQPAIDGSLNPERIPERVAYSTLFRLLAHLGPARAQAYIAQKGLGDPAVTLPLVEEYRRAVADLDAGAGRLKDENWPNPSAAAMAELRQLQQEKNALVRRLASRLPAEFHAHALSMRSRIRLQTADVPPDQWGGNQ